MNERPAFQFKIATEDWEFELIHRLNYQTFVEEIPQHQPSATRRLVDKFHAENTYLIGLCGGELAGMLALRGRRPFSLDQKIPNLDSYLPAGHSMCEIRLLAVDKQFRSGQVFHGLLGLMWQYSQQQGYNLAVISGTTRQAKLYRHLGFTPFGPLVGSGDAQFQPMLLTLETFAPKVGEFFRNTPPAPPLPAARVNFLPGPVAVHPAVRRAFEQFPESHRSAAFLADLQATKKMLCGLVGAKKVELLLGSGTLANDAVAGQLALENRPGLVVSNGEFGERLMDQARRFGLAFNTLKFPWGTPLDYTAIGQQLDRSPAPGWLWCAHGETSAGVLNELPRLKALCAERGVKLCLDCISSIGTAPVQLDGVYLASGVSGKGLGAYPGLSMVFYHHDITPAPEKLPRYLDLGLYARTEGTPFTHSSNLLHALQTAVQRIDWPGRLGELALESSRLRAQLRELGFHILAAETDAAPAVITIVLPANISSTEVGQRLQAAGYLLSYNSEYLRHRNWVQICLMGEYQREQLELLANILSRFCALPPAQPAAVNGYHRPETQPARPIPEPNLA
jgi:aspartate aminotransferase-like enzyme